MLGSARLRPVCALFSFSHRRPCVGGFIVQRHARGRSIVPPLRSETYLNPERTFAVRRTPPGRRYVIRLAPGTGIAARSTRQVHLATTVAEGGLLEEKILPG